MGSVYSKALKIAEEHFRRMNPSMWDGIGERPTDFHSRRITYSMNRYTELDISFEQDIGNWQHCCKLRDTMTSELLGICYGNGIDSPQDLINTILKISKKIGGIHLEYKELKQIFQALKRSSPREDLTAHIIFTEDSFDQPYSLLSRTYRVSSDNKAFWSSKGDRSIFAYCLDKGSDQGVRLDWYMAEERNPNGWKVEDCYILERMRDAAAIPDYGRTAQMDGTVCYYFGDTCIQTRESYEKNRVHLEPVAGNRVACGEWAELPIDRVYGYCTLLERYLNQRAGA